MDFLQKKITIEVNEFYEADEWIGSFSQLPAFILCVLCGNEFPGSGLFCLHGQRSTPSKTACDYLLCSLWNQVTINQHFPAVDL